MRAGFIYIFCLLIFYSCGNKESSNANENEVHEKDKQVFFPVTSYIRGQMTDIKTSGLNPLKYTSQGNQKDSSWIKSEDFEKEFGDFLYPVIDSNNMVSFFSEKSFMDQTLNLITLTYDPIKELPDSIQWKHWDVYIDPATNAIQRIYLVKQIAADKTAQLTWQSGKKCKMVVLKEDEKGVSFLDTQTEIKWNE